MPGTKFVILAARRTGSNLLCTLLNSHRDILCHHELFNPRGVFYALDHRDGSIDLGTVEERDRDPLGFLARVWTAPSEGVSCAGFKVTRGQSEAVLDRVLDDPEILKIVVYRKNRLKTLVSELVAEAKDQWEAYEGDDIASDVPRIEISVDQLKAYTAMNEAFYEEIQSSMTASGQAYIRVFYETLFSLGEQARILKFLGVEPEPGMLVPKSVKQNPRDLRNVIANFSELDAILEGTVYHRELHERGD